MHIQQLLRKISSALTATCLIALSGCSSPQKAPPPPEVAVDKTPLANPFPYPELEKDFEDLAYYAIELAQLYTQDQQTFQWLSMPYGPLDIGESQGLSPDRLRSFKNFFFGFSARAFNANPDALTQLFFCDELCWFVRQKFAESKLETLSKVIESFRKMERVVTIAKWMDDEYRVNEIFSMRHSKFRLATASKNAGLLPSGVWRQLTEKDLKKAYKEMGIKQSRLNEVLRSLRQTGFTTLRKEPNGNIRAIADGFADNEWGLLFGANHSESVVQSGQPGAALSGGKEISYSVKVRNDVVFYLTGAKRKKIAP